MSIAKYGGVSPHTKSFEFEHKHIKKYPHFDAVMSLDEANALAFLPDDNSKYSFFPFLSYTNVIRRPPHEMWVEKNGEITKEWRSRDKKPRPIRYASHKDSLYLKFYREKLVPIFEAELIKRNLTDSIIAYRKIPKGTGDKNKSNIEFAAEAFRKVRDLKDCCAVAVDISGYFNNIEHEILHAKVKSLIGETKFTADWQHLLQNVTKYRFVDLEKAYVALGYSAYENGRLKFSVKPKKIPKQLCTNKQFREKILPLVEENDGPAGIPQGLPISDILANLYLLDVDKILNEYAKNLGGFYFRYSDDILMILPGNSKEAIRAEEFINCQLISFSDYLQISSNKTEVSVFKNGIALESINPVVDSDKKHEIFEEQGISYLGFRFDGKTVYLRNNTITNLRRKVVKSCKAISHNHVDRYGGKSLPWLIENIDMNKIKRRFLRIENFGYNKTIQDPILKKLRLDEPQRNFLSYLKRAEEEFSDFDHKFRRQIRKIDKLIEDTVLKTLRSYSERLK